MHATPRLRHTTTRARTAALALAGTLLAVAATTGAPGTTATADAAEAVSYTPHGWKMLPGHADGWYRPPSREASTSTHRRTRPVR